MCDRRISRHELNIEFAQLVSKRSTCSRALVGAVIVIEGRVVSTGYNGSPAGLPHCIDEGCLPGPDGGCIRTSHAESGAIAFAARKGVALEGATLYCTMSPCLTCAKLIINAGIKKVIFLTRYRKDEGVRLLLSAGLDVGHFLNCGEGGEITWLQL